MWRPMAVAFGRLMSTKIAIVDAGWHFVQADRDPHGCRATLHSCSYASLGARRRSARAIGRHPAGLSRVPGALSGNPVAPRAFGFRLQRFALPLRSRPCIAGFIPAAANSLTCLLRLAQSPACRVFSASTLARPLCSTKYSQRHEQFIARAFYLAQRTIYTIVNLLPILITTTLEETWLRE